MELNLPKDTLPAPRPGKTIKESFPPPPAPALAPEVATGPLEVLRYAPEGDVPLAPNLSVTFNQPMVALTGIGDLAKQDVPVKLSPQPDGQWRWVGTKTLVFEPLQRRASPRAASPLRRSTPSRSRPARPRRTAASWRRR